ncbi:hypothetical protein Nepgr_022874 [Nepenthes gracilis]|uniref:Uncharacterized protein n=1 Tax=Nepenthes gracilis TaxID=150966 RepID=A0AAD3T2V6_NEPGR|nr:hypothetical protein Nepgr_022874 [Nepenthes gracilis]
MNLGSTSRSSKSAPTAKNIIKQPSHHSKDLVVEAKAKRNQVTTATSCNSILRSSHSSLSEQFIHLEPNYIPAGSAMINSKDHIRKCNNQHQQLSAIQNSRTCPNSNLQHRHSPY